MRSFQILVILLGALFAFALLVAALVLFGALAMRARHRKRAGVLRVSRLGGLLLASAFLGFQRIVHPHVRHAIVQELEDHNDAGDEVPRGGRGYHRQLRRIRRGEEVGKLQLVRDAQDPSP